MREFFEKTIGIWLIVVAVFILVSIQHCENETSDYPTHKGIGFDTVEIDSCEYLIGGNAYQGYMAHKGNCKYCAKKNIK